MNPVLLGLLAYVLVQFAIGVWVSRRIANEKDYILAGRSLGTGLVTFSVFATWFGAEAIIATPGEIYKNGISGATVDPFAYSAALIIAGLLLAARLWRRGITTFADVFRERYSVGVERLVVIILLPGSVFWAAAQIRAFGQVLASTDSLDLTSAITLAAALVAAYSIVGGLMADAVTDFLQGLVVIVGLIVLTVAVAAAVGGFGAGLSRVPAEKLMFMNGGDEDWLERIEHITVAICGSLVAVELISRFLGARSADVARTGTIAGGLMYLALGLLPVYLGLMATVIAAGDSSFTGKVGEAEQLVAVLARDYLPSWYYIVFCGAIISAILSVVHAALHAPAAQISHNILSRVRPHLGSHGRLWSVRLTVMGLSVVAFALALHYSRIKELVETASAFGSAGVFVTAMFALFTRIGGPWAAVASMLTGTGLWATGKFALDWQAPYLAALAVASAVYIVAAALVGRLVGPHAAAAPPPHVRREVHPHGPQAAGETGSDGPLGPLLAKHGRRAKRRKKR